MPQFTPEPEMTEFEQSLAALSPARGLINRDRLMFEAGRRSATVPRRLRWAWPAVAASLAAVAAGQTLALSRRPEPRIVERVVVVREPAVEAERPVHPVIVLSRGPADARPWRDESIALGSAVTFRRQVERYGLEGLPDPSPLLTHSAGEIVPSDDRETLRAFDLDKVLNLGGPS